MKPLFTIKEVAQAFALSTFTIHRWIKDGKLRAVRIGGSIRVRAEEIERFVNAGEKVEA